MKTCISSYSFNRLLQSGEYTQLSLVKLVKEMGFDAIEFTDLIVPENMRKADYATQIREECDKFCLPVANYTVGAELLGCSDFDEEIARICEQVDTAVILGAKGLRHDASGGFKGEERSFKSFEQALPILAKGCKAVTGYAASKGVVTMVENHGYFCQDSDRVEKLVAAVADKNFGVLIDMGNFLCADEAPEFAVGRLASYAKHVHCKDFHLKSGRGVDPGNGFFRSRAGNYLRGSIIGHGDVPVLQCLSVLGMSGYNGYVSIEFEGMEENLMAIEIGLNNLENYIELAEFC
ncbi:MAG: sugar phosphate isomerase/epimerase family protein [Acutalibacteraceae bacterium]|jgi:sugar phosphate isomerase/epimerase